MRRTIVVYIHGKGGNPDESLHYRPLFPGCEVIGFDYQSQTPWDARAEFRLFFEKLYSEDADIVLIANSIGAFFALHALQDLPLKQAFLISPIVNMEQLIYDMMLWAGVSEQELQVKGIIQTSFGETLSYEYLNWVRCNPIHWNSQTAILYGNTDHLQSYDIVRCFAEKISANLTIMAGGEHWFHTESQMAFLDRWIQENRLP